MKTITNANGLTNIEQTAVVILRTAAVKDTKNAGFTFITTAQIELEAAKLEYAAIEDKPVVFKAIVAKCKRLLGTAVANGEADKIGRNAWNIAIWHAYQDFSFANLMINITNGAEYWITARSEASEYLENVRLARAYAQKELA